MKQTRTWIEVILYFEMAIILVVAFSLFLLATHLETWSEPVPHANAAPVFETKK